MILNSAVESTTDAYCTDSSGFFADLLGCDLGLMYVGPWPNIEELHLYCWAEAQPSMKSILHQSEVTPIYYLSHMGDTLLIKNQQKDLTNQHTSQLRDDSIAEFKIIQNIS